jgi:hypothetical protein
MVCGDVHPNDRFFDRGCCKTLPRLAAFYESVDPMFLGLFHFFTPYSHLVWPTNLVYCALFNTLHSQDVGI